MKIIKNISALLLMFVFASCSTTSVRINQSTSAVPIVAVLPLTGEYGEQVSDLIIEQLAINGIPTVERVQVEAILKEHGYKGNPNFDQSTLADYGRMFGVKKVFVGTISAVKGPLYSFPHVNISLKLVDVATGKVLWVGHYGNSLWTSAISTQGDIQRGAKAIVKEFIKVYGMEI